MKILVSILMLLTTANIYSQDTIYLNKKYKKINQDDQAQYFRIISRDAESKKIFIEQTYFMNGKIKLERKYSNYYSKKKKLEKHTVWYEAGRIHIEGNYKGGIRDGYFISYWKSGQLKRKDSYKKGVLIEGRCWDKSGIEIAYYDFEIPPEFPGGKEGLSIYIHKNINYANIPASSKGRSVKISFVIDIDGSVKDVTVREGLDPNSDLEAKRLVQNMPKWKPAMQDGKKVKVTRTLPLTF